MVYNTLSLNIFSRRLELPEIVDCSLNVLQMYAKTFVYSIHLLNTIPMYGFIKDLVMPFEYRKKTTNFSAQGFTSITTKYVSCTTCLDAIGTAAHKQTRQTTCRYILSVVEGGDCSQLSNILTWQNLKQLIVRYVLSLLCLVSLLEFPSRDALNNYCNLKLYPFISNKQTSMRLR